MQATFEDIDTNDYWNTDLEALPSIGHTLIIGSAPKGTHHVVRDLIHHIGGVQQRVVIKISRKHRNDGHVS